MHLADAKKGEGESLQSLWDRELLTDLIGQETWRKIVWPITRWSNPELYVRGLKALKDRDNKIITSHSALVRSLSLVTHVTNTKRPILVSFVAERRGKF